MKKITVAALAVLAGCASPASPRPTPVIAAANDRVIPTRYVADRFFATAVLPRGDTASFFLDTGSGTYVWDAYIPWLELNVRDTITTARGAKIALAPFPTFRADASLPAAITETLQGTRLQVGAVDYRASNNFIAWIARTSQGQLGSNWFNGRVWTFDYPNRRLTLHDSAPVDVPPTAHEVPFHFPVDSAGHRVGHSGYVDVVIDGDTLALIMDTGATVWLTSHALAAVHDGGPSERSTTHIAKWVFTRLRQRHPDWPVVEHADLWSDLSLIRVPSVSVAGYDLGPAWLSALAGGPTTPPVGVPNAPAWTNRQGGTLGGSLLRSFVVTLDYPRGVVRFDRPARE